MVKHYRLTEAVFPAIQYNGSNLNDIEQLINQYDISHDYYFGSQIVNCITVINKIYGVQYLHETDYVMIHPEWGPVVLQAHIFESRYEEVKDGENQNQLRGNCIADDIYNNSVLRRETSEDPE